MLYRASHYKRLGLNNFIYPKKEKLGVLTLSNANLWALLSFRSSCFMQRNVQDSPKSPEKTVFLCMIFQLSFLHMKQQCAVITR